MLWATLSPNFYWIHQVHKQVGLFPMFSKYLGNKLIKENRLIDFSLQNMLSEREQFTSFNYVFNACCNLKIYPKSWIRDTSYTDGNVGDIKWYIARDILRLSPFCSTLQILWNIKSLQIAGVEDAVVVSSIHWKAENGWLLNMFKYELGAHDLPIPLSVPKLQIL